MNLKSKSILNFILLVLLKIVLIYLIFIQFKSTSVLSQYIDNETLNQKTLNDLETLKDEIKSNQTIFKNYDNNKQVKSSKEYNSSIRNATLRLSQIQYNYKSSVAYKEIMKNNLLEKKIDLLNVNTASLRLNLDKDFNQFYKSESNGIIKISEKELLLKNQKAMSSLINLTNQFVDLLNQFAKENNSFFLKQSIEEEEMRRNLASVIAFFSLVLLLFLLYYISEVFRVKEELDTANVKIQGDLILKNKILSFLTHEIKTPVSVIRYVELFDFGKNARSRNKRYFWIHPIHRKRTNFDSQSGIRACQIR